jgi:hypothetical protein
MRMVICLQKYIPEPLVPVSSGLDVEIAIAKLKKYKTR